MFVMQDEIYEDNEGHLFSKEYLEHNRENVSDYKKVDKWSVLGTITCNYSQLFSEEDCLILANNITRYYEQLDLENGDDSVDEIFQFYIIDDVLARFLSNHTNEIIYYWEDLDVYVLGVTHFGTSWDYVGAEYRI